MSRAKSTGKTILHELVEAIDLLGESAVRVALKEAMLRHGRVAKTPAPTSLDKKGNFKPAIRADDIQFAINKLRNVGSREEAKRHLELSEFSRRELEMLARSVDVPVRKDMKIGDIEDLIVNMTVGGRLNSRAIRGI